MAFKELNTTINDFSRWFKKEVKDITSKSSLTAAQKTVIESKLPEVVYEKITEAEQIQGLSGAQKMARVTTLVKEYLVAQGLSALMPIVKLWLEKSVLFVYRKYFLVQMQKLGLNDMLESLLNIDLDSDSDIGGKPVVVPVPASALFGGSAVEPTAKS